MSLYKDASLVMLPSAYKDGKLYSIRPTDGSGDFTFSRGSNLAATRVDVNGLIEKGRENLLLYSQDFSNAAWSKSNLSLTANQTDPLGGTNAFLFTSTSASNNLFVQSLSNQNKVCSIYAKAGNRSIFGIVNNTYGNGATFDLSAETAVSSGQGSLAVIEDVGNGWYRCSVYFSLGTQFLVVLSDVNGSGYSNGDTISFFGSQMELGTIATDYIETGTSAAQSGILEDMPRLDYSGGASCPSLLLEPQRTNLIPHSEYFADYSWIKFNNSSVSANTTISPDGYQNADSIIYDGTSSGRVEQIISGVTSGATYTFSVYVKVASGTQSFFIGHGAVNEPFTATTEWQRFSVSDVPVGTTSYARVRCDSANTLFVWGAQLEQGSYPTSYIPTYGTSQTRSADDCNKTGITSLIGQTEGVLFIEFEFSKDVDAPYRVSLSDGTSANRIQLGTYGDQIQVYVQTGGATQVYELSGTLSVGTTYKAALAYKANDYVCYLNGSQLFTDTSASVPACSKVGYEIPDGTGLFEHPLKQQVLFKTRLTNAELAALTTI